MARSRPLVLLLSVLIGLLAGCGTTIRDREQVEVDGATAYVVAGGGIGPGNLDQMELQLFAGGVDQSARGLLIAGFQGSPRGCDDYLRLDANRRGHRVWAVPVRAGRPQPAIIYLTMVASSGSGVWWSSYMPKPFWGGLPINGPLTAQDDDGRHLAGFACASGFNFHPDRAQWDFNACRFTIDKPGVYYVGDFGIAGTLEKQEKYDAGYIRLACREAHAGDAAACRAFLAGCGLGGQPFFDVSSTHGVVAGKDWYRLISGE